MRVHGPWVGMEQLEDPGRMVRVIDFNDGIMTDLQLCDMLKCHARHVPYRTRPRFPQYSATSCGDSDGYGRWRPASDKSLNLQVYVVRQECPSGLMRLTLLNVTHFSPRRT